MSLPDAAMGTWFRLLVIEPPAWAPPRWRPSARWPERS